MEAVITKAAAADLPAVAQIYEDIIARQDRGGPYIGWQSGVYPTLETARAALERDELFVQRRGGKGRGLCHHQPDPGGCLRPGCLAVSGAG